MEVLFYNPPESDGEPMNRNSIRWRLPASYALIALLAALSLGSVMLLVLRSYYARQEQVYLFGNARALRPVLEEWMQSDLPEVLLQDQIHGLAFLSQTQIRLFDSTARVIADSGVPGQNQVVAVSGAQGPGNVVFSVPADSQPGQGPVLIYRNNGDLPPQVIPLESQIPPKSGRVEIMLSVNASPYGYGFVSESGFDPIRRSSQVVNVPLMASSGEPLGVLEFSNGPSYGADVIRSVSLAWLIASVFAIAIAVLAGWVASQRVTRPVLALEQATQQMERGDLSVRVDLPHEQQQEFLSLAHSFNGMAGQVEQTVSTLRSFISDAAHELHTPLTALQTNLELARDEENASALTLYLSRAQEQGQRLEALVTSLLDLSRVESTGDESSFAPVNLSNLLSKTAEQYASRGEQANRILELDLPAEPIEIMGNEMQLNQVFVNLLGNALKFTRDNDTIRLSAKVTEGNFIIEVMDTGVGIPADDLPNIFKRFHRGRNVSNIAGNGLGLAIVKAIVERHGGTVRVNSHGVDMGSTFAITLPARL